MTYILGHLIYPYPWIAGALVLGLIVGWLSCGPSRS